MKFSPITNCFYEDNRSDIPPGAVDVSFDLYKSVLNESYTGRAISSDANGMPILVDMPEMSEEVLAAQARRKRSRLLSECDWTILPDSPVNKEQWAAYRQALRDITAQPGFPTSIEWPVAPV